MMLYSCTQVSEELEQLVIILRRSSSCRALDIIIKINNDYSTIVVVIIIICHHHRYHHYHLYCFSMPATKLQHDCSSGNRKLPFSQLPFLEDGESPPIALDCRGCGHTVSKCGVGWPCLHWHEPLSLAPPCGGRCCGISENKPAHDRVFCGM